MHRHSNKTAYPDKYFQLGVGQSRKLGEQGPGIVSSSAKEIAAATFGESYSGLIRTKVNEKGIVCVNHASERVPVLRFY